MEENKKWHFRTEELCVGYGQQQVLAQVNLQVEAGEILTLIGPNGAGKTTLLKTMIGQLPALEGVVYVNQRAYEDFSAKEKAKETAVVLTTPIRTEYMTVEEVVAMGRYPYTGRFGVLGSRDKKIIEEVMEQTHILQWKWHNYQNLSDGQKQRVLLARALCQEPKLLILDEPTSYLDLGYKVAFLSLLQKLARQKEMAVIVSMHELDLALRIADQIACVYQGKIQSFGLAEEVCEAELMEQCYGLPNDSYIQNYGTAELNKPEGEPSIFVFGGAGTATPFYRQLQRTQQAFRTGILWEEDLDYPVAKALAEEVISLPAFSPLTEEALQKVREVLAVSREIYCTFPLERYGIHAKKIGILLEEVERKKKIIKVYQF